MKKRIALVTGSTRGVGLGIATELIKSNHVVYINGRDQAEVSARTSSLGIDARPLVADMLDPAKIRSALDLICSAEGGLDLIVSNIGSGRTKPGWDVPFEDVRRSFEINFFGPALLINESIKQLKPGGHVVIIASIAGMEVLGAPISYAAAKSALISYAKNLARSVSALGIRVNVVCPGNVMFEGSVWEEKRKQDPDSVDAMIRREVPLNTFVTPEEIGRAVVFLEESPTMTGATITVDGGQVRSL